MKVPFMNLNQVTLLATNIAQSKVFYQNLGFILIVDTERYLRFACPIGDSTFSLVKTKKTANATTTIYFEHPRLDTWVDELINNNIEFTSLPQNKSYLWREASLSDPSGNKLILYWAGENRLHPPWKVKETSE